VVYTDEIINTRALQMVSHTVAHYRICFAHYGEEQINLSSSQLYRHSKEHKNSWSYSTALQNRCLHITNIERSKTLSQHFLLFVCLVCNSVHIDHTYFATQKQYWWNRDNPPKPTTIGLHHTGAL